MLVVAPCPSNSIGRRKGEKTLLQETQKPREAGLSWDVQGHGGEDAAQPLTQVLCPSGSVPLDWWAAQHRAKGWQCWGRGRGYRGGDVTR